MERVPGPGRLSGLGVLWGVRSHTENGDQAWFGWSILIKGGRLCNSGRMTFIHVRWDVTSHGLAFFGGLTGISAGLEPSYL